MVFITLFFDPVFKIKSYNEQLVLVVQTEIRGDRGGKMEKTAVQSVIMGKWRGLRPGRLLFHVY